MIADDQVVDGELGDVQPYFLAELWLELTDGELSNGDGADGDGSDGNGTGGGCGCGGETGGCGGLHDAGWTRQKSHAAIVDLRYECGSV